MSKYRIVFNDYNVDAFLAVCLIINTIAESEKDNQNFAIETVPHSVTNYTSPNKESDFTFCVGTNMELFDILAEAEKSNNFFYIGYDKFINGEDITNKLKYKENCLIFTSDFMWGKPLLDTEDVYAKNLCKLTQQMLTKYFTVFGENDLPILPIDELTRSVCDAVENYCNFSDITAEELALVHNNMDNIVNGAFNAKPTIFNNINRTTDIKLKSSRTTKARSIISKGMSNHTYGDQKSSMVVPTLNCSEDYLYDLIRLISYPFDITALYQDIKHQRQWWIYSNDISKANRLAEMIPYHSKHYDGKIIYLVSEMPKIMM